MKLYDVGILGAGVAGSFATYKLCQNNKNLKVAIVDIGRPPLKRRRQMEGWLGCFPTSDGKLYDTDLKLAETICKKDLVNSNFKYLEDMFKSLFEFDITKTKKASKLTQDSLKANNYSIEYHNYHQMFPKNVHLISKFMNKFVEDHENLSYYFDEEILSVTRDEKGFFVETNYNEFYCKNILLSTGRSGWRFTKQIFDYFGLNQEDKYCTFGLRAELGESSLEGFNKSVCTLNKDNFTIGKLSWNGTTIQEDHIDFAISTYRSNENRWKSEKVSFDILCKMECENASYESERISKLAFLLGNDRVIKEKVSIFLENKAKISPLKEYNWTNNLFNDLNNIVPGFTEKAYVYYPTLKTQAPKINIKENLETEVEGLYVAGESSGNQGLLYSAITGLVFADSFGVK